MRIKNTNRREEKRTRKRSTSDCDKHRDDQLIIGRGVSLVGCWSHKLIFLLCVRSELLLFVVLLRSRGSGKTKGHHRTQMENNGQICRKVNERRETRDGEKVGETKKDFTARSQSIRKIQRYISWLLACVSST